MNEKDLEMAKMAANGNVDGLTIILMSVTILEREIREHIENKKKEYDLNKEDMKMDDFESFMKHFSAFADIKGTEMAMEAISLSIATFCFSLQYNVDLHKLADIIKELGNETSAEEVMESVHNKSGKPFEDLKARMIKEFNLAEDVAHDQVIKGVAEWVMQFLLETKPREEEPDTPVAQA